MNEQATPTGQSGPPQLGLVLDCRDPEALAPFWAAALGYVVVGAVDSYTMLLPDGREGPQLLLQRVPEERATKNRMHLDIHTPDIEAMATQLEAMGATRLPPGTVSELGHSWIPMADPEGNEFCVCSADNC
jgi:predicted enzyme related to lactoylglutathione lyase